MRRYKKIICRMVITTAAVLLTLSYGWPLAKSQTKVRKEALNYYSMGEYLQAKEILFQLIAEDNKAEQIVDYYMLADIYIRSGELDSARAMIDLAWERTNSGTDSLLIKRNEEFLTELKEQLKYKIEYLKVPALKPLESYLPPKTAAKQDTSKTTLSAPDSTVKDTLQMSIKAVSDTIAVDSGAISAEVEYKKPPEFTLSGTEPKIAGGMMALQEYIAQNNLFPEPAIEAGIEQGMVLVEVTVDTAGQVVDINIIRCEPPEIGFEDAALEVLENMHYIPAERDSGKVAGKLTLPVMFRKR